MTTPEVLIVGARTPMADYAGALKDVSAIELGAIAARGHPLGMSGTRLMLTPAAGAASSRQEARVGDRLHRRRPGIAAIVETCN